MKRVFSTLAILIALVSATTAQSKLDSTAFRAMQVGRVMQQERVFLHFDNSAYYLGETMWFKAYVSFGEDNRPSSLSKVLYVELVAPEGYVVETKKYKIGDDGSCHGEFELNPLLLSGYYEVRAYTRYMLNWDKSAIFSRVFAVFDKVNADNWDFKNMLDRKRGFSRNGEWISSELPEASLTFFPEGGNLVAGLESRVAYELRGENGLFGEEKVTILEDGVKLLETTPQHLGKGSFTFTPKAGAKYRAEVTMTDSKGKQKKHRFELPEIEPEGVVMRVNENGDRITVNIADNFAEPIELGFVVLHRGMMGFYRKFTTDGQNAFSFAKDSLREGVNRAVLFIDNNTPLAERHFFVMHDSLMQSDHGTVKLNVTANGTNPNDLSLSPHQKVTVRVSREDGKPITEESNISLAVSDAIGKQTTSYSHNLYTYLLLGSELKGYLPDAAQYFDPDNKNRKEQLELVMLTHGWTSYDWSMLAREDIGNIQPIERGITIKGKFILKSRSDKFGSYGEARLIPQKNTLSRFDIATDGKNVQTSTFRTDSTGSFVLETDDFYGTRVASLKPQTAMRQGKNIAYQFALDRYYSPEFRLYDYWENHLGKPMSKSQSDSLVKMNPFEFMLSSLEVTAKKKHEFNTRPPHSEMRFNYLDEWEYAQDVTYLEIFKTYENDVYNNVKTELVFEHGALTDAQSLTDENNVTDTRGVDAVENDEIISLSSGTERYVGNIRYGTEVRTLTVDHDYDHILTANDVVLSAMKRHNYNWAYWVQLMVVDGEYSHDTTPEPDMEYLRGLPDAEKMTHFKEFVIRSDENTRSQFENRATHWVPLTRMLDNKIPIQKFYLGFLSQSYLFAGDGIDGSPDIRSFIDRLHNEQGGGINYPINPNYVACMIPYTEEESTQGVVPEFAAPSSTMRYTSVQGYSESKQFYSPDYGAMIPQEKDYRRTLYWNPSVKIENGEAVMEFYNSSGCNNITVDVIGRDNHIIFSNDGITRTRFNEKPQNTGKAEQNVAQQPKEVPMDSITLAACAYHHERAMIYYNQKRYKDAITMLAELAQYRYAPSLYYVGLCYLNGTGLTKNEQQAYRFINDAAVRGEARAMYDLAVMTENGTGTEADKAKAHDLFIKAAEQEEPRALVEMGHRYLNGIMVPQDKTKAEEMLRKGAELKYPVAMLEYGKLLQADGRGGLEYIIAAADEKNEEALLILIEHERNAGNEKNVYKFARELHILGNNRGTKIMADCYYEGKGIGRDKSLAKDLYREAANAGNEEAKEKLKEI